MAYFKRINPIAFTVSLTIVVSVMAVAQFLRAKPASEIDAAYMLGIIIGFCIAWLARSSALSKE